MVKIVTSPGNSGNNGGDWSRDGLLNSNHWGTGWGKTAGDLGERVPWVPRGTQRTKITEKVHKPLLGL